MNPERTAVKDEQKTGVNDDKKTVIDILLGMVDPDKSLDKIDENIENAILSLFTQIVKEEQ
jgi:hypothetical protein